MQWVYLGLSIAFAIGFALGANAAKVFTRLVPSVWTGIGSVGVVLLGALIFHEKLTLTKVVCFAAVIAGVVGLQLVGGG